MYNPSRDRTGILILEVHRFTDPMTKTLLNYLVSKYGIEFFYVIDFSGNNQLDGYILAGIENPNNLYIFSIAVHENYENKGWGSILLEHIISKARLRGMVSISLHVDKTNDSAKNLYKKFGFIESTIVQDYYGPGVPGILMELSLDSKIK